MKLTLNIVLILWISISFGQEKEEVFSVYFHKNSTKDLTGLNSFSKMHFKVYSLDESDKNGLQVAAGENLIIDETGVYIEKNKLLWVTREQVRENSKYEVRNGYLFGVVANDSVPTTLDGEKYLFLIPTQTYLFEVGKESSLLFKGATNDDYLIFTKEPNGHYSCIYMSIKAGSLTMKELVLDSEKCAVKNVKNKETIKGDFNTYILNPTQKEWSVLFSCFVMYDEYTGPF